MEIFVWLARFAIPLIGWWMVTRNFQLLALRLQKRWRWDGQFHHEFFRSFLISFCHGTPENHCDSLKASPLNLRLRLLWLGLRSLSYGFIFIVLFGIWSYLPAPVFLLLGLVFFLVSQWWKPVQNLAFFFLGLGLFIWGFESLMAASGGLTQAAEQQSWIYILASNYLPGALMGVCMGGLIRILTRMSGVAWWVGMNLLLSGILSLGGAWGFFLGDFLVGLLEDYRRHEEKDFRIRFGLGFGFGLALLLMSAPFQWTVMNWINGEYSVQLRSLQLGFMIFLFLTLESALALGVFHFYFLKKREN